jgi:hypothetical protein
VQHREVRGTDLLCAQEEADRRERDAGQEAQEGQAGGPPSRCFEGGQSNHEHVDKEHQGGVVYDEYTPTHQGVALHQGWYLRINLL